MIRSAFESIDLDIIDENLLFFYKKLLNEYSMDYAQKVKAHFLISNETGLLKVIEY